VITDTITSLLGALPMPALMIGRAERIVGANSLATNLLGRGVVGRHFITGLRQPGILDAIENTLRDGEPRVTRFLAGQDGHDTTYNVNCARVETDVGGGVLVCFEDVTHLEQAGQMRRDFVANVSHELRTPLTALLGFIETLRGPALGDVVATDRFLSMMQAEAERMEHLVHDLLSLSRVEAQERVRPTEPVDLNAMIGSVIHGLRPLARQSDVEIAADQPDTALTVPGDTEQLRQVVSNLIENAIKYGGQSKTIHVRLETTESEPLVRGPAAVITVRDEGPGIAPEHIPRLTERFYRVDSHRSRAMGGTGLGLAIVKHIVGRHRGRLRIESTPGEGATFRVILPRDPMFRGRDAT
jgi:two-component system phosphate regulon sensor histidine kinase PhoR